MNFVLNSFRFRFHFLFLFWQIIQGKLINEAEEENEEYRVEY